jgi:hypothetical protein
MANVGSEVERAIRWKEKGNASYSEQAFFRALELLDFTLDDPKNRRRGLKEIARVREALVDFFAGNNAFHSSASDWSKYFLSFAFAARKDR